MLEDLNIIKSYFNSDGPVPNACASFDPPTSVYHEATYG